jgi:hypothetical protein
MNYSQIGEMLTRVAGGDYRVIGELADAGMPELAQKLAGKDFRGINANNDFGLEADVCLPLVGPAGGSVATTVPFTLTNAPARAFVPSRVLLGSTLPGVQVNTFTIGTTPQFLATTGSVPGEAFSPLAIENKWKFSACPTNTVCTITGINSSISATANILFGALFGASTQA